MAPLTAYWLSIEVHLEPPLVLVADDGTTERARLRGFVQELGVTAPDEPGMRAIVHAHVGTYPLGDSRAAEVVVVEAEILDDESLAELRSELQARAEEDAAESQSAHHSAAPPIEVDGVWYEGGRAFYSEDPT